VAACIEHGTLWVQVRDHGVGGARFDGSGLLGLADSLTVGTTDFGLSGPGSRGRLIAADVSLPG
jgi:hypothetical protein